MSKKSKVKTIMICESCQHEPVGTINGEWLKISTTCPKCGGHVRIEFVNVNNDRCFYE